jgi:hypothetical protein
VLLAYGTLYCLFCTCLRPFAFDYYIYSTLLDPLHFDKGDWDANWGYYSDLCNETTRGWAEEKLADLAQERQEAWIGKWVAQMTRIAKPGAPVILESNALPLCEQWFDWGGVTKEWWNASIMDNRYGWDVDPEFLVFGKDLNNHGRYHVAMRRNNVSS